jgi:hypothetical protein
MFTTSDSRIHVVSYLDLFNRAENAFTTILTKESGYISEPTGIDAVTTEQFVFVNGKFSETAGTLMSATHSETSADDHSPLTVTTLTTDENGIGLVVAGDSAFYISSNALWKTSLATKSTTLVAQGFTDPTSITYSDKHVYIVDHDSN